MTARATLARLSLAPRLAMAPPLYRPGMRCPACSAGNWHVGRTSAECGRCGYPLLLAHPEKDPWQ